MNQHDIRLNDTDDPKTPHSLVKEIKKSTSDASEKYETFVVTHEPINLKEKLHLKQMASAQQQTALSNDDNAISAEEYTDRDDDELGL